MTPPRVVDADVKGILDTTINTSPFILTAHLMVDEELLGLGSYSDDRLIQIELWLAAHFACMMDPRERAVQIGASATFEGYTHMDLDFTRYGQQVKILDTSGTLARMDKTRGRVTVSKRFEQPLPPLNTDSTI